MRYQPEVTIEDCKLLLGLVAMLLLPMCTTAQFTENLHKSMDKRPKIIFKFDTRKSFIDGSNATVFGWKVGVEFDKRIRIGGGFNNLTESHSANLNRVVFAENGIDTLHIAVLQFNYICYFVDYVLIQKPKWEISYPIQFGIGTSHYSYNDETSGLVELDKHTVMLLETAITGHYKVTPWVGIGVGAGYRLMLVNNKALEQKFNSPIYIIKLKIFLGSIINTFSKNKEAAEEKED